jgi:uncharacterized protein (TIGR00251 family)
MAGISFVVRVSPRSSRNEVSIDECGILIVRTTAPPADGAANKAVLKLVADALGIAKSSLQIKSGRASRHKVLLLDEVTQDELDNRLKKLRSANRNVKV